jgi:hypothetical protein
LTSIGWSSVKQHATALLNLHGLFGKNKVKFFCLLAAGLLNMLETDLNQRLCD